MCFKKQYEKMEEPKYVNMIMLLLEISILICFFVYIFIFLLFFVSISQYF